MLMSTAAMKNWAWRRPLTRPDHAFLARLLPVRDDDPSEKKARVAAANSTALRRHFGELSTAFLLPFEPFIRPQLPPGNNEPVPQGGPPLMPAFSHTAFLEALPARPIPATWTVTFIPCHTPELRLLNVLATHQLLHITAFAAQHDTGSRPLSRRPHCVRQAGSCFCAGKPAATVPGALFGAAGLHSVLQALHRITQFRLLV